MDNFWATIAGAAVGGIFTLLGGWFSYRWQQKSLKKKERKTLRNALCAVKLEFEGFWKSYNSSLDFAEEQYSENRNLVFHLIKQESFPIYQHNISLLSQLQDGELLQLMIRTHMGFCALLDKIEMQNLAIAKYGDIIFKYIDSKDSFYKEEALRFCSELNKLSSDQKETCKKIDKLMTELTPKLDKTIQSLQ